MHARNYSEKGELTTQPHKGQFDFDADIFD